eukprot:1041678-Rhodomonas_salina.1
MAQTEESRPDTAGTAASDRKVSDVHVELGSAGSKPQSAASSQQKKMVETDRGGMALLGNQLKKAKDDKEKMLFKAYDEQQSLVMQEIVLERVVYSCAFSPNNIFVITGSADSLMRMYKFTDEGQSTLEEVLIVPKDLSLIHI